MRQQGALRALALSDGRELWRAPAGDEDWLLFALGDTIGRWHFGEIALYDARTGAPAGSLDPPGDWFSAVGDGGRAFALGAEHIVCYYEAE